MTDPKFSMSVSPSATNLEETFTTQALFNLRSHQAWRINRIEEPVKKQPGMNTKECARLPVCVRDPLSLHAA